VDCGEGTFGQLNVLNGPDRIDDVLVNLHAILITHAHLDHFGGIYPVITERLKAFKRKGLTYVPLVLVCDWNVRRPIALYKCNFADIEQYLHIVVIPFYYQIPFTIMTEEQRPSSTFDVACHFPNWNMEPVKEKWNLKSVKAVHVHHTRMASGFIFDTMCGKRYVFSGDTMPCELLAQEGANADLVVHEATFGDGFEEDAKRKKHSTMVQALSVLKDMNAKYGVLSHFSARYPRIPDLSDELLAAGNVGVAFDNLVIPYNKRHLLPALLPLFKVLFEQELTEYTFKNMQRELRIEEEAAAAEPLTSMSNAAGTTEPEQKKMKAAVPTSD